MTDSAPAPPPELIQLVTLGEDVTSIRNLLLKGEAKVNDTDSSGMTALHHAAYKGNADLCKMLIDHGGDVNSDSHDHRYSPLHFAALSGNVEAVQHLLTAGARTYHTNTLGRTATQMAAFVGNHAVVALINNYVPMCDVTQYTQPSGLEKEAKLPSSAAKAVYDLIMQVNLHPVRIALIVGASDILQVNINKVICMKFHYLAYVLKTLEKELKKMDLETQKKTDTCIFESIIRKWLRSRSSDGVEEHLEYYIRDAIKAFPWVEMPLFIQLVRNMSGNHLGDTSSLCILSGCINGQRAFQDDKACSTCGHEMSKDLKKCSKCKMVQYCDKCCQKLHWPIHKKFCDKLCVEYQKQEKKLQEERRKEEEEKESKKASATADIEEKKDEDHDKDLASQAKSINVS
ncbi:hypothetical protein O3P69_020779 [Scylla paramamosain]|uniref:MYND-type domain-containing protein n=1 Tax=Scylla paramamosain TaxID=85552 RepID=A0AAW0TRR8_SCYPA